MIAINGCLRATRWLQMRIEVVEVERCEDDSLMT
jgi:hypothetical protein